MNTGSKTGKLDFKNKSAKFKIGNYNYDGFLTEEESGDKTFEGNEEEIKFGNLSYLPPKSNKEEFVDLPPMPPLEGDEEVKEEKELKILTPNKLLTRFYQY